MTELLLGMGIAAATGYGLFERWRRTHDGAAAEAQRQHAESIRQTVEMRTVSARHAQEAAESAVEASRLLNTAIAESVSVSKVHAEASASARIAAEAIVLSMGQIADVFERNAEKAAELAEKERRAWTERLEVETASHMAAMQTLKDAAVLAESSSVAASKAAAAVSEAAELYCEQLNIPRRSDAAQRRRWEAFTSAIKDGAEPLDALKGVS